VFYDVTEGNTDVNCTGANNCYTPSDSYGVLSTSNTSYAPAYAATTGWDFATGIGSVNAANLVNQWPSPQATLSTASLRFVSQTVGLAFGPLIATLSNPGNAPLTIDSVAITGANATDFKQTNTCGSSVAAGASCNISVTFTPGAAGSRSAALSINDGAPTSPQTVTLSGRVGFTLDADGNGVASPFSDGIIIFRYLAGLTGPALTADALGTGATRTDPSAITAYLDSMKAAGLLDVDGNGVASPFSDGIIIDRYLAGLTGPALTTDALGAGATRTDPAAIAAFLSLLMP
jgi:hypothetical protein